MKQRIFIAVILITTFLPGAAFCQAAKNPVVYADVPDPSIIRVGRNYYMSSTTMHLSPGLPIMKSTDLVNWKLVRYAYNTLADTDELALRNGLNAYGRGSWASCLRYHRGVYYVSTFSQTTGRTYIFSTNNLETGKWRRRSFAPSYHDHSLFFDDDGRAYLVYGSGDLKIVTLNKDLTGVESGSERTLIPNASEPAGKDIMLPAEGSQLFHVGKMYYLFNIVWPRGGMRTTIVHRAKSLQGPWEGKLVLQDLGVAQGGLIQAADGHWFSYLFRDYGAVGRTPYLLPVTWIDGWPMPGVNGKVPGNAGLRPQQPALPWIVSNDEFSATNDGRLLGAWQWNHNPDNRYWSLTKRPGYLRLTTGRVDSNFTAARNTLTQRTFGPRSSAQTKVDVSGLQDGDIAGLGLLQQHYGFVGVRVTGTKKELLMMDAGGEHTKTSQVIPLSSDVVYLRTDCDFTNKKDEATFSYSLDGVHWSRIGTTLKMTYTLPHFMGYRFSLFSFATKKTGGSADFDYYHITDK